MTPFELILTILGGITLLLLGYVLGKKIGAISAERKWERLVPKLREDATKRSRAVLTGQFSEQLATYLPGFGHAPNEARFVGKPIDFIVFKGLDERKVEEVVFVEVKSGGSKLSSVERSLKEAIEMGKVRWEEYRVPTQD